MEWGLPTSSWQVLDDEAARSSSSQQPRVSDRTSRDEAASPTASIFDSPPRKSRDEVLRSIWGPDGAPRAPERTKRRRQRSSEEALVNLRRGSDITDEPSFRAYARTLDFGSDDEAPRSSLQMSTIAPVATLETPAPSTAPAVSSVATVPAQPLHATTPVRRRSSLRSLRAALSSATSDSTAELASSNTSVADLTPARPMRGAGLERRLSRSQEELPAGCRKPGLNR